MSTPPIFHRGVVLGNNEENTLPAFRDAAARGRGSEVDLQPTSDDKMVVFHDATWDRMTPHTGQVSDTTLAEAKTYQTNGGNEILQLGRVIDVSSPTDPLLLDVKLQGWTNAGLQEMERIIAGKNALDRCFVFTHERELIAQIREAAPGIKMLYRSLDDEYDWNLITDLGCVGVQATEESMTQSRVAAWKRNGFKVFIQNYSVDNQDQLQRARNLDAHGVVIDAEKWDRWT